MIYTGFNRYRLVLDEQPENLDVMMSLATVYEEQGKEEEALQLVDFGNIQKLSYCQSTDISFSYSHGQTSSST